jgi:flagellar L-ring protein precursor FlgH
MSKFFFIFFIILGGVISSCVPHIAPYKPKKRIYHYEGGIREKQLPKDGSLWSESSNMNNLFSTHKTLNIGDIVTIKIYDSASATGQANTETNKETSTDISVSAMMNFMNYLAAQYPNIDKEALIKQAYKHDFKGSGKTSRKGVLTATITATIKQILPSNNYFIEGQKVILVNKEEQHFYISGVVRPKDISDDNIINSDRIANAQIEFTGRGSISDKQSEGWFSRFLSFIWRF